MDNTMFKKIKRKILSLEYPKFLKVFIDNVAGYQTVIDLGCGMNKIKGAIGIDKNFPSSADVIADIYHLPLRNNQVDLIIARSVLEHIDDPIAVFKEFHTILKPGGKFRAYVPHAFGRDAFDDPTHKSFYTLNTIDYFYGKAMKYYIGKIKFKLSYLKLRIKINPPTNNIHMKIMLELVLFPFNIIIILLGFALPRFFEEFIKLPFLVGELYFELIKE